MLSLGCSLVEHAGRQAAPVMSARAKPISCCLKKSGDQARLRASWMPYSVRGTAPPPLFQTRYEEYPMAVYRALHTGPKTWTWCIHLLSWRAGAGATASGLCSHCICAGQPQDAGRHGETRCCWCVVSIWVVLRQLGSLVSDTGSVCVAGVILPSLVGSSLASSGSYTSP